VVQGNPSQQHKTLRARTCKVRCRRVLLQVDLGRCKDFHILKSRLQRLQLHDNLVRNQTPPRSFRDGQQLSRC
jgi:hypothetical protein